MRAFAIAAVLASLLTSTAALAQASPSPFTNATRYDLMGRVTGTISADPDTVGTGNPFLAVRTTYDAAGRPIKVETGTLSAWQSEAVAPAGWTGFTVQQSVATLYDSMGRKVRDTLREGAAGTIRTVTQYSYDVLGRPECTAVRMNPALFGSLPASACVPSTPQHVDYGPDRISRNFYDAAGQRLMLREGVATGYEGLEAAWTYNLNGQVTMVIDGNGNRAELRYDGHGRQRCWLFPSTTRPAAFNDATHATTLATAGGVNGNCVNSGDFELYEYDPNGNRTSFRKRDGSLLGYQYDALNRMSVKIVPDRAGLDPIHERDVSYAYDLRGRQTAALFDSLTGEGVTTAYDGFGRQASSSTNMGGTTRTLAYQHDRNGNRTRVTHPDAQYFTYQFDGLDRLSMIRDPGNVQVAAASYDAPGRPSTLMFTGGIGTTLSHDSVSRLSGVSHNLFGTTQDVSWTYTRNPASQLFTAARTNDAYAWTAYYAVNRPYTTDGLNRYTSAGTAAFLYDANGNLTSDGTSTYTYDIENRLVTASGGLTLTYDPLGRLYQTAGGASGTTRYLYDGDALVAEYNAAGILLHRFVHGVGSEVPLVWFEGATLSQRRNLHADHQGSIVAIGQPSAAALAINAYDEYGIPAATNLGRFQYTGQIWLADLGMYHYKARVYSPTLGRFLQTDPIGYEDQFNLYTYVGNDPVNVADPSGLLRDFVLTWAIGVDRMASVDDNLSLEDQALAENNLMSAANLTMDMDANGSLPSDSKAALSALRSISVSEARAGLDTDRSNFNINMAEMRSWVASMSNQGEAAAVSAATVIAGSIIHDGTHSIQNLAGQLAENHFSSVPDSGTSQRARFDTLVWSSERAANQVQMQFYAASPAPRHVVDSLTRFLQNLSAIAILNRFHR